MLVIFNMKDKIFNLFKKYILEIVDVKFPVKRKRKYSPAYFLQNFIYVLSEVVKWESLQKLYPNEKTYHWKTIYNEFVKWSNYDVFKEAFEKMISHTYCKISKIKKNKKLKLFIDVTKITNKYGHDSIGINCEYTKKNVTALTIICDQNKLPLAAKCIDINKTIYNNRKTFQHEIKNVQATIDEIPFKLKKYVKVDLIGDRGYITKQKFKVFDRELPIVTPKRKNQKTKNSHNERILLRERHKVENMFAKLKSNNRIQIRRERKVKHYMSFIYIAMLQMHLAHMLNN